MKKYLFLGVFVAAVLFAMPLWAAESVKIKLPDGLYFYKSDVDVLKDGSNGVKFDNYFVVQNNIIYSSLDALQKFGELKLNKLFTEKKKYKILAGGKKIGELHPIKDEDYGSIIYDTELFVKIINDGPMWSKDARNRLGSAARCIAVPEDYKESNKRVKKNGISKEEAERILKLVEDNLLRLAKKRKEFTRSKSYPQPPSYKDDYVSIEELQFLDKIPSRNGDTYIGLYWYHFHNAGVLQIVFSLKNNKVSIITTDHDDETLKGSEMNVPCMFDVDECGYKELLVEKHFDPPYAYDSSTEIYKQKADGNWTRIQKIKETYSQWWANLRSRSVALARKYAKNLKLPDGLYLYDSSTEQVANGGVRIYFQKYFVVKNNVIYDSKAAIEKYGISKLNKQLTKNKKYKILLGGEKIGEVYNVKIDEWGLDYKDKILTKKLKEGPLYGNSTNGSAVRFMGVPEQYKATPRKVYNTISKVEIDKVSKIAKDKLLPLVIKQPELLEHKIKEKDLRKAQLVSLDKIFYQNGETYIGTYANDFDANEGSFNFNVVFNINKDNASVITSDLSAGKIYGMLDVDNCGEDELITEEESAGEDEVVTTIEIYKWKADGNWTRIYYMENWRKT